MLVTLARFFSQGGIFMWVILAILGCALAVVIERLVFYLITCRSNAQALTAGVARDLNAGKPAEALARVKRGRGPLHAILATALERFADGLPHAMIRQGVEEVAIREMPRLSHRLNYLALCANIATLTGLLGTIFGLQQSFSSLGAAEAAQKAAMLAAGISQAMNTTAFGLMVAIPCMVAYSVLSNMQTRIAEDVDATAVKVLNFLAVHREDDPRSPVPAASDSSPTYAQEAQGCIG